MTYEEKMVVNSALTILLDDARHLEWLEQAKIVVNLCQKVPDTKLFSLSQTRTESGQENLQGHVQGFGNVEIPTEKGGFVETESQTFERVGHYKIHKNSSFHSIIFQHYLSRSLIQEMMIGGYQPVYHIVYDPRSLEPYKVCQIRVKIYSFTFWKTTYSLLVNYYEPFRWLGEKPKTEHYFFGLGGTRRF